MRKAILLTAAAAFLAVPAVVQGQDATVTAKATIEGFAEFVDPASDNLDFETLAAGEDAEVTTDDARAAVLPIRHNVGFTLGFTGLTAKLTGANTEDEIEITYYCEWVPQDGTATPDGATPCVEGQPGAYTGTGVQEGELRIGGKLLDTNVAADSYEATLTIEITADS
jgi:hypothetical protein